MAAAQVAVVFGGIAFSMNTRIIVLDADAVAHGAGGPGAQCAWALQPGGVSGPSRAQDQGSLP